MDINPSSDNNPKRDLSQGALSKLNQDFILIGKTRIHPWYAWLVIGMDGTPNK